MSTIPFSYHLFHKPTQKHYYGIKYAKGCTPSDLWVTYFSTSLPVKKLIKEYGENSFIVTVRKTFSTPSEALAWEHKVLRRLRAAERPDWLNRHNGGSKFRGPKTHSPTARAKMSRKVRGVPKTEIHKQQISESIKNYWNSTTELGSQRMKAAQEVSLQWRKENHDSFYSEERNNKMANTKRGCKRQYLPDGSFIMVKPSH
jgi:hypothetical protein